MIIVIYEALLLIQHFLSLIDVLPAKKLSLDAKDCNLKNEICVCRKQVNEKLDRDPESVMG